MQAIRYQHGVQEDEVKIYGAGHSFGEGAVELDISFRYGNVICKLVKRQQRNLNL